MPKYNVILKTQGQIHSDDAKRGEVALAEYSNLVFKDLALKLSLIKTTGRVESFTNTYERVTPDTIAAVFKYTITAENEELAASEAYDWILAWKNTHGQTPEVEVNDFKTLEAHKISEEHSDTFEEEKLKKDALEEPAQEVKGLGRPPINR